MDSPLAEVSQDGPRVTADLLAREVDTDELRQLINELRSRLHDDGGRTFVFGLERVEFLPSACLALLLMFYQDVKKHEGRIVLLNAQENVAFLLRLARLDKLFELAEGDPADA
ncbi:MAG: STAS domain-containing protein [Planctomycetota bacterium]